MKGFDQKYRDVPDYILSITREIWEQRGVGPALRRHYADDVLVRAANGMLTDNRGVIAATLQTLHEFPDRQLLGEDVIWRDTGDGGYLSSHRLLSDMTHTGDGIYGNATGKNVRSRIIADCYIRNNQVTEEWLARDQAAFARCLGVTPKDLAEKQARHDLSTHGKVVYFTPAVDVRGTFQPVIENSDEAQSYANAWRGIWNDQHLAAIELHYDPEAVVEIPGGERIAGHAAMDRFVISYLASFPDADFQIDDLMVNAGTHGVSKVAMRWSVSAQHLGWGHFGAPTGADVYILGFAHAHVKGSKILKEWIVADEVAIWKQIIAGRKQASSE